MKNNDVPRKDIFGFYVVVVVCAQFKTKKVFYYVVETMGVREIEYVFIFNADFASNLFKPF